MSLVLLACALLLRIAIPAGWMPVQDADGLRLTLCTGMGPLDGPAEVAMTMPGHGHAMPGHGGHDMGDHPCTFAALALALTDPALPPPLVPPSAAAPDHPIATGAVAIGRGLAAPPPPSTGPPALA